MHSAFNQVHCIAVWRKLFYVNYKRHGIAAGKLPGPADNKFFRVVIEVPFVERRRIHRIEKLLDSIDENLDPVKRSLP